MTKELFTERLTENKYCATDQEVLEYKLPVVQFYITNYTNTTLQFISNNVATTISSKDIKIKEPISQESYRLINLAFELIRNIIINKAVKWQHQD